MATLAVAATDEDGANTGQVAAAGGGDAFPNDGHTLFVVRNGGGAPITVTIVEIGRAHV